jgi:excisionase family DNA binding protein
LGCSRTKENNVSDKIAYTINEAAAASGLGRTTIYKLIKHGELKPAKIGARTLLLRADVVGLIERGVAA